MDLFPYPYPICNVDLQSNDFLIFEKGQYCVDYKILFIDLYNGKISFVAKESTVNLNLVYEPHSIKTGFEIKWTPLDTRDHFY